MEQEHADPAITSEAPAVAGIFCPQCAEPLDLSSACGPVMICAHCGNQFFNPVLDQPNESSLDDPEVEEVSEEEELSALRIKQMSTLRRTAYRTRSYFIIGTLAAGWLAIVLVIQTEKFVRQYHKWGLQPIGYLLFAWAALVIATKLGKRTLKIQHDINAELRARELEELEAFRQERDFSALSDGSQHARHLEHMTAANVIPAAGASSTDAASSPEKAGYEA